jgi:hypothetical protein
MAAVAPCELEFYEWPVALVRDERLASGQPTVTVEVFSRLSNCRIPINLRAHLVLPPGLLKSPESVCAHTTAIKTCMIVQSNYFATKSWEIWAGGLLLRRRSGTMGTQEILLDEPTDCGPLRVFVDFDRKPEAKQTWIDEIRF